MGQIYLNANESAFPPYQMPENETWNPIRIFYRPVGESLRSLCKCEP